MKMTPQHITCAFIAALLLGCALACGGDEEPDAPDQGAFIGGITIAPREIVVEAGEQINFTGMISSNDTIYGEWRAPDGILEAQEGTTFATYTPPPAPGEYFVRYEVPGRPELFAEARVVIREPTTRGIKQDVKPIAGPLTALRMSPRGERVAAIDPRGEQVIILGAASLGYEGRIEAAAIDVGWSRSGAQVAVVSEDLVRVFNTGTGYKELTIKLDDAISAVISDDGVSLFVAAVGALNGDCTLFEANLRTAERRAIYRGSCDAERMVRGPDGASLILDGGAAQHFSQLTGQRLPTLYARNVAGALRPRLFFNPQATLLLAAGRGQATYHLLRGPDFEDPFFVGGTGTPIWDAATAPSGDRAALALGPGLDAPWGGALPQERFNLSVINMADGSVAREYVIGEPRSLFGVSFAGPDHVIVAGEEGVVWRYDLTTAAPTARYPAQQ